jgi:hypothetical protein
MPAYRGMTRLAVQLVREAGLQVLAIKDGSRHRFIETDRGRLIVPHGTHKSLRLVQHLRLSIREMQRGQRMIRGATTKPLNDPSSD